MHLISQKLTIKSWYLKLIINYLTINGETARLVGGAVRDALLGRRVKDIDIATTHKPEQVIAILANHHIKTIPTGIKHGTITAIIAAEKFEITTLRHDLQCDGRHANVAFSRDYREDAARRDFTINALSYCPISEQLFDYFDGLKHLTTKQVIFIGDAELRIQEDFLRILRFFRFSANYAIKINQLGLQACQKLSSGIRKLSAERIKTEFDLILNSVNSTAILARLSQTEILAEILPIKEYHFEKYQALLTNKFNIFITTQMKYTLLLVDITEAELTIFLKKFFTKKEQKQITDFWQLIKLDEVNQLLKLKELWLTQMNFQQYFILAIIFSKQAETITTLLKKLINTPLPLFPLTGRDLLKIGYRGKILGEKLTFLRKKWLLSDFTLNQTELLTMVKK